MGAAPQLTPVLTLLKDGETIRSFPLEGEALVGRAEGCVIRLDDRAISRQHALLKLVSGGVQIERKSPFAPIAVNGAEITRALLKQGDIVAIGPYHLKLAEPSAMAVVDPAEKQKALPGEGPVATEMPSVEDILGHAAQGADGSAAQAGFAQQSDVAELAPSEAGDPQPFDQPQEPQGGNASGISLAPAGAASISISPSGTEQIELAGSAPAPDPDFPESHQDVAAPGLEAAPEGADSGFGAGASLSSGNISLESPMTGMPGAEALVPPPIPPQTSQLTQAPVEEAAEDAVTSAISLSRVEAKLLLSEGREFQISKDEVVLGRAKDCDLSIDDRKASRRNSVIRRQGGRFFIRDLGSANGTHVNGVKLSDEIPLSSDDIIRIGDAEFVFQATSMSYAEAALPERSAPSAGAPSVDFGSLGQPGESDGATSGGFSPGYGDAPQDVGQLGGDLGSGLQPFPDEAVSVNPIGQVLGDSQTASLPLPAGVPGAPPSPGGFIPGIDDIPGASPAGKGTLLEKYRALPPARKAIWTVIILALFYFLFIEEDEPPVPAKKPVANAKQNAAAGPDAAAKKITLESLTPEQRKNLDTWHDLAFDYYKNREYDKALFELGKIFAIIPDYKDSREIERYAKEGKRQLEAREAERKQAEEEARVKARIAQLVTEITDRMNKKQYAQAKELFAEILTLDPDNEIVSRFQRELESVEEQRKLTEQQKELSREVIARAREIYAEGLALKSRGKYHSAIGVFGRVLEINPADATLIRKAKAGIASSRQLIADARDPALAEGKQLEESGELAKAFKAYERANRADPGHPQARAGMERIRGVLHERAKMSYTEAVLAESYSDFTTAKQKFQECLDTAPADDIYYERAKRKLSRYFVKEEVPQ